MGFAAMVGRSGCWLAPAAFALDRVTKLWAVSALGDGHSIDIWPGVLRFTYLENTGMAFGLLQGRQELLAVLTGIILAGLLVWLILRGKQMTTSLNLGLWLLLGGAAGNLYDRIRYGYVIDFIEIRLFRFPVFNVADSLVCIAFAVLVVWILTGGEWKRDGRGEA